MNVIIYQCSGSKQVKYGCQPQFQIFFVAQEVSYHFRKSFHKHKITCREIMKSAALRTKSEKKSELTCCCCCGC